MKKFHLFLKEDIRTILQLLLLVSCMVLAFSATVARAATPQTHIGGAGMYGLLPMEAPPTDYRTEDFLDHPQFAGISVRTWWDHVEPTEGNYNWVYIDSMIAKAASYGKKVILRIDQGYDATPDWLYTAGAQAFSFQEPDTGQTERLPVPWDPVYLQKMSQLVAAFGARYNNNPTVWMVHIAGPAWRGVEMYLPKTATDRTNWLAIGYTTQKLIDAWKDFIDLYATHFPDKLLALNLHVSIFSDGVSTALGNYAATAYPWHCSLKICFWQDDTTTTYEPVGALVANSDEFTFGGLEPVGWFGAGQIGGDIAVSIQSAIAWHMLAYNEPYIGNINELTPLYSEMTKYKQMIASTAFNVTTGNGQAQLTWTNPSGYSGFQQVKILRKTGGFPAGATDAAATVVYQGSAQSKLDTGLTNGTHYYYSMFELPSGYTIAQGNATPVGDVDNDGLTNDEETRDLDPDTIGVQNPFNPNDPDTTGDLLQSGPDGVPDGQNDWDGDGFANRIEFAAGTNPTDPLSFPQRADNLIMIALAATGAAILLLGCKHLGHVRTSVH